MREHDRTVCSSLPLKTKLCTAATPLITLGLFSSFLFLQERAGVKMILIQDGSQSANMDKPLRIIGDPYKVQVSSETPT